MNPSVKISEIQRRFPEILGDFNGWPETVVNNVLPPAQADAASLVFVLEPKFIDDALASPAACLVFSAKAKPEIEKRKPSARNILFSKNVKLAMALVKSTYFAAEVPLQEPGRVHPTAVIDPSAVLGKGVSIGAFSVIGQNVTLGEGVRLDASVVIEAGSKIGKDSHLYSHIYIGPRTEIGERCEIQPHCAIGTEGFGFAHDERGRFYRIPQTGKVVLQNDVEVGSGTTIDRSTFGTTLIGEGTKIDKQAHIAHNCEIGKHCVFAGKFAVAGSTKIGDHVIAGGRVTVKDGISVSSGVEIAGLSGVQRSIETPGQFGGYPVQPVRDFLRTSMSLVQLPQLRKDVTAILKHLGLGDESRAEESK